MRGIYFLIPCKCGHQNKIPWIEELAGEVRLSNCKKCKSKLKVDFPNSPPENTAEIPSAQQYVSNHGYLELQESSNHKLSRYAIKKNYNEIGRISSEKSIDIPIITNDMRISRIHFAIHVQHYGQGLKKFAIQAFSKTNGTTVNNRKLEEEQVVYLKNGDCIEVGDSSLIFRTEN